MLSLPLTLRRNVGLRFAVNGSLLMQDKKQEELAILYRQVQTKRRPPLSAKQVPPRRRPQVLKNWGDDKEIFPAKPSRFPVILWRVLFIVTFLRLRLDLMALLLIYKVFQKKFRKN